jgi:hypothetical protein
LNNINQREIIDRALCASKTPTLELMLNIAKQSSLIQALIARVMAIGIWRVHLVD